MDYLTLQNLSKSMNQPDTNKLGLSGIDDALISNFRLKKMELSYRQDPDIDQKIEESNMINSESSKNSPIQQPITTGGQIVIKAKTVLMVGFRNHVWKTGALRIIYIVSRFIVAMMMKSDRLRFSFLNADVFQSIGDKSADFDYYLHGGMIRVYMKDTFYSRLKQTIRQSRLRVVLQHTIEHILSNITVIKPNSTLKIFWDIIVMTMLTINITYIPMKLAFHLEVDGYMAKLILDSLPNYIFIAEILLNFNTAFYSHGVLVTHKLAIAKHYLNQNFVLDLVVLIPFVVSRFATLQYVDFVLMFRIQRIPGIIENLEEVFNLRTRFAALLDVSKLVAFFVFVSHLIACAWFFVGNIERNSQQNSWVYRYHIYQQSWDRQYILSLYWSTITTLTIGYGDIVGYTQLEQIFIIVVAISSSIMFGYIITSIGQIVQQIGEVRKKQRDQMSQINNYLRLRGMNGELQVRVKKFFEYYLQIDEQTDKHCELMLSKMNESLQREVKIDFYKKYLQKSRILRNTFADKFVDQLCLHVKEKYYHPEEILFSSNQPLQNLYIIMKGEVELSLNQSRLNVVKKNGILGENFYLTDRVSLYTAKSLGFLRVGYITKEDFQRILEENPTEQEKYFEIRHRLMMNEIVQGCELCNRQHELQKCIFAWYCPNPRKVYHKSQIIKNDREVHMRSISSRYNTLQNLQKTQGKTIQRWLKQSHFNLEQLDSNLIELYGLVQFEDSEFTHEADQMIQMTRNHSQATIGSKKNGSLERGGIITSKQFIQVSIDRGLESFQMDSRSHRPSPKNLQEQKMLDVIKYQYLNDLDERTAQIDTNKEYLSYYTTGNLTKVVESYNRLQITRQIRTSKLKRLMGKNGESPVPGYNSKRRVTMIRKSFLSGN